MLKWWVLLSCLYLSGCFMNTSTVTPEYRKKMASTLAKSAGLKEHTIHTNLFILKAFGSEKSKSKVLTIYIEGDGLAWISSDRVSDNPTPIELTGLKIAIHDKKNHPVAYIARPCQLLGKEEWLNCQPAYWTHLRFSPEVLESMNQGIDYLKKYYHVSEIKLIGYSGGGTIAALLAARRSDVIRLITIAGILDLKKWTDLKSLTPLQGSLDPSEIWKNLIAINQTHWVGGKDKIVPPEIAFSYVNYFPPENKPKVIVIPEFDHVCCWATDWISS